VDQARGEIVKVERVFNELRAQGRAEPDGAQLLKRSHEFLEKAQQHRRNGQHSEAYIDAEASLRAVRLLMRTHWDRAVHDLDTPAASPYALSFFTLPKHWELLAQLKDMKPGASVLPGGDFELESKAVQAGWNIQEIPSRDPVEYRFRRVGAADVGSLPHGGNQCLMIEVKQKAAPKPVAGKPAAKQPPILGLERTYVALHSPPVRLAPGSLVRISAWVRTKQSIGCSSDGALFYDSVGGEPLGVRITYEPKWKRFALFRRVPPSGTISVVLAMSGLGTVFFDDVKIEPLVAGGMAGGAGSALPDRLPTPAGARPGASPPRPGTVRGVRGN
jgi:hypothetical protein